MVDKTPCKVGSNVSLMDGMGFLRFFEFYNYNGQEVEQPIDEIKPNGASYCTFARFLPNTYEIVVHDPYIVYDLDRDISPIMVHPKIWKFAFEKSLGFFKIKTNTTVKLILSSSDRLKILKAPISLLLLICQKRYKLEDLDEEKIELLAKQWLSLIPLYDKMSEISEIAPLEYFSHFNLNIELRIEKSIIDEVFTILKSSHNSIIHKYVEEFWYIDYEKAKSDKKKAKKNKRYKFKWTPGYIRDESIDNLRIAWDNCEDLERCSILGDNYRVFNINKDNFQYNKNKILQSWTTLTLSRTPLPVVAPIRMLDEFNVKYENLDEINIRDIPVDIERLSHQFNILEFVDFYKKTFNKSIELKNFHDGFFYFLELPDKSKDIPMSLIVKSETFSHVIKGYTMGMNTLFYLFEHKFSKEMRFFTFKLGEIIYEYDAEMLQFFFNKSLEDVSGSIINLLKKLIVLRNDYKFQVNLSLNDSLTNGFMREYYWQATYFANGTLNCWVKVDGKYLQVYSPEELEEQIEKEVKEASEIYNPEHPIVQMVEMMTGERPTPEFDDDEFDE